jgi:hypothetical protein
MMPPLVPRSQQGEADDHDGQCDERTKVTPSRLSATRAMAMSSASAARQTQFALRGSLF